MDNGRGTSVFLPDNRLRLSRLTSTRDERDKIEEVVKHFTFSKLADPETNESIPNDNNTTNSSEHISETLHILQLSQLAHILVRHLCKGRTCNASCR